MKFQADKKHVSVTGRTIYREGIRYLGYSATSISFKFIGTKATAEIVSDASKHTEKERAWIAIYYGQDRDPAKRLRLEQDRQTIVLFETQQTTEQQITIVKYSEAEYAACGIVSIEITDEVNPGEEILLSPPVHKKRQIEFFGDSITCGYGVEGDVSDEIFDTADENPTKSYSLLTAELLDAEPNLVSWNGKGVITAYIGEEEDAQIDDSWLMPMLYEYTDAGLERDYFANEQSDWETWNFEEYKPQLVVIYLGTNDASYTRDIPDRQKQFEDAYVKLLHQVHEHNPNAAIITTIGAMDQRLNTTIDAATACFAKVTPDCTIRYVQLPLQDEVDGLGTYWHPTEKTNRKCARLIADAAKEMLQW